MIFIDMDGVLCDFVGAALRVHGREDALASWPAGEWDIAKVIGLDDASFWSRIDAEGTGFWAELQPFPWVNDLVNTALRLDDVVIASRPYKGHYSSAGKQLWLQKHLQGRFADPHHQMFGGQKQLLAGPGRVLIDDNDKNVTLFISGGGLGVLVPQPWNAMHDDYYNAAEVKYRYVLEKLIATRVWE